MRAGTALCGFGLALADGTAVVDSAGAGAFGAVSETLPALTVTVALPWPSVAA